MTHVIATVTLTIDGGFRSTLQPLCFYSMYITVELHC